MIDQAEAVVGQRLLDHGEAIAVERAEEIEVGERVRGVAIDVEREARKRGPDRGDHVEVPAGPELELDPREALGDRFVDLLHQDVERVLDTEVGADGDAIARATEGHVQRHALALGLQHPPGDLERGPRELVALHEVETAEQVLRRADVLADDAAGHVLTHRVEGRQRVLGGIVGNVGRAALSPGVMPLALHPHQHGVGIVLIAIGGLPHERQRHPHPVDLDGLDDHEQAPPHATRRFPSRLRQPGPGVKEVL